MSLKILWVEQNDSIYSPLEDILQLEKFHIIWTEEEKCAIQIAQEMQPNLIISRLNINDRNTHLFIERLTQNEATASIPLIIITSDEGAEGDRHTHSPNNQYWTTPKKVGDMIQKCIGEKICCSQ